MSERYRAHLSSTVLIRQETLVSRNRTCQEWGLFALRDLPAGTFVGFYSGDYLPDQAGTSAYTVRMGRFEPCIVPFRDETSISREERVLHPLASMNEPPAGEHANCHMQAQDFSASEIQGLDPAPASVPVRFYRGLACFACDDVKEGSALTWHYGTAYQPMRDEKRYEAGYLCKKVLDGEAFVASDSAAVLRAIERVPVECVYPIRGSHQSERFKPARRRGVRARDDSESEPDFSSGSDADTSEGYRPRPTKSRS